MARKSEEHYEQYEELWSQFRELHADYLKAKIKFIETENKRTVLESKLEGIIEENVKTKT